MLDYCIDKARRHASNGRVVCYAVICDKKGNILSEAGNQYLVSHPYQFKIAKKVGLEEKQFLHAEVAAIVKLPRNTKQPHSIYISRVRKDGTPAPAAPCPICQHALSLLGIKNIIHS